MTEVRRFVRFLDADGRLRIGELHGDEVAPLVGDLFGETRAAGAAVPLASVRLLAPVVPSKVIGIGTNYRAHALEMGKPVPPVPKIFLKPSTSVIGHGDAIPLPPGAQRVDHEAELGVVVGRTLCRATPSEAMRGVLGYTVVNDVTARDFQRADGVFARAKGFDGFCPLGPAIAVGLDPSDLAVRARVCGVTRQDGRTSDLIFDVPTLLAFVSGVMTLCPGDVIATGTPSGVGPLVAGDVVEVEVEGVGVLRNPVVDREDRKGGAAGA